MRSFRVLEKARRNIFIGLASSIIIYLILTFYAKIENVLEAFNQFTWSYIILIFAFSYLNFVIRYLKWEYYLKVLSFKVEKWTSYQIFMSSLTMGITPGKVGELIKSYMIKQTSRIPISRSAPIILAERITELLSLLLIGLAGLFFYDKWKFQVVIITILLLLVILFLSNQKFSHWILLKLNKFSLIRKHVNNLSTALESSRKLLKIKPLIVTLVISFISWICEGLVFYFIIVSLNIEISIIKTFFVYSFSIIIGSISMIPGGLGITEGSFTYLLEQSGVAKNFAVAAVLIFRIATLWFALILGSFSLIIFQKKVGKSNFTDADLSEMEP